jgi:hypothetical protein
MYVGRGLGAELTVKFALEPYLMVPGSDSHRQVRRFAASGTCHTVLASVFSQISWLEIPAVDKGKNTISLISLNF